LRVSDLGRVYALGEGNKQGQLGFGNPFTGWPEKGGMYQAIPKLVTPSGSFKYKSHPSDIKITQVTCGGSFSIARELSIDEGIELVIGFKELENALAFLRKQYSESEAIQRVWSIVRQERFRIAKQAEGQVLVWGTGSHGELGLGNFTTHSLFPQRIFKFRDISITYIAAGAKHVLAIDSKARLFSWGCGSGGRLGHGDFEDRQTPELVSFFGSLYVEQCAAGDAHSAVLTTSRSGDRLTQQRRLSTFGRGAHGRLGNGTNRNICTPILVSKWLPSVKDMQLLQVACGGAHTLLLMYRKVPHCIANPRGIETVVLAWGYGANGQLGTGYRNHSFIPVKARIPKWDLIVQISAGRSWSLARSAGGELYSWGKGLRGQLGQDTMKFCMAPKKIEPAFASFLHISSGYAHNVAIVTPKRNLSTELTEILAKSQGESYNPFIPYVRRGLRQRTCTSLYEFDCCRRVSIVSGNISVGWHD
jgi:hypothetical protein